MALETAVVYAVPVEEPNLGEFRKTVFLAKTGLGTARVSAFTWDLLSRNQEIKRVIRIGIVGGIGLEVGEIVIPSHFFRLLSKESPVRFSPDERLFSIATQKGRFKTPIICTIPDRMRRPRQEKLLMIYRKEYKTVAVDMETAEIARVCSSYEIPFLAAVVVGDKIEEGASWRKAQTTIPSLTKQLEIKKLEREFLLPFLQIITNGANF